jgi:orotate phosphoribosyltransferase
MNLKERAIEFFLQEQVLKFGDFTLKSGRKSPYFFNTGSLCSSRQLMTMGELYAEKMQEIEAFRGADVIFGSAYKGIPISVATAIAMQDTRPEIRSVSDRKEAKTHGDASAFLGVIKSGDKVVIVDDVITDGATKVEALEKLRNVGCEPLGFIIAFDRAEPGKNGSGTARESFEKQTGLPVYPLVDVNDIAELKPDFKEVLAGYMAQFAL